MAAEPIVFVPPMMCDVRVFGPQLGALSSDHAVMFAPTTQGERIEEIASQILTWAPSKFALCGAGMGGAVSLEIMRRARERVIRLALMSTSALAETPQQASTREPHIVAARTGRFADVISKEMPTSWLADTAHRLDVADLFRDMALHLGPEAYVRQARAMQRRRDQQASLHTFKLPCLILSGDEDGHIPVSKQQLLADMIPDARFEVVVGAGCLPMLEQPDAVTGHLRSWMRQALVLR